MTIKSTDFRSAVLNPALDALVPAGIPRSPAADALVFATIANESLVGTWLVQDGGPALGIGQIEPASLNDLITALTPPQRMAIQKIATPEPYSVQVVTNLKLAVALVRLFYYHKPFALVATPTIAWVWATYKTYYNTAAGAASMGEFIDNLSLTDLKLR